MSWTVLDFAFESILSSAKMTNLSNNFAAFANGDSGSPKIQTAAIANDAVDFADNINDTVSDGTINIGSGAYQLVPVGNMNLRTETGNNAYIDYYADGRWVRNGTLFAGFQTKVISDGANIRVGGFSGTNQVKFRRSFV